MAGSTGGTVSRDTLRDWGLSLLWLNLLAAPVLFSARTTEAFELPKLALLRAVALLLLAGAAAVFAGKGGVTRSREWLGSVAGELIALGVLLSLLAAAASTLTSISPRTSLLGAQGSFTGLFTLVAYTVLFFATRALCPDPASARTVLTGAATGLGVSIVYGLVQFGGLDPLRWEAPVVFSGVARVFSTQGHPNSFAQLLAAGLPVAVYLLVRALQARRLGEAVLLGSVVVAVTGLALLTLSRAGALAVGTAVVVLVAGGAFALDGRRRWLALGGLGGLLALGALLAALPDERGPSVGALWERLANLGRGSLVSEDPRRFLWAGAWATFREHPLVGVGLDCFSLAFGPHRTPDAWDAEWGETPLKAHSQPLEILATRGLLGALAALVVVFGVVRALPRALRRPDGDPFLVLAAFAGLLAFGVHNLFHFPTAAGTSLAVTLGAILSRQSEAKPKEQASPFAIPVSRVLSVGAVATGLLYVLVLAPLRADVLCRAGTSVTLTDPRLAVAYGREAVRFDASRDLLWLRLAAAYQAVARTEREPLVRKELFEEGRRAAETAVRLVSSSAYGQAHLGTLLADLERESPPLSDRAEVEQAFARARDLDPNNSFIHMAAATAALAAGDRERAFSWAGLCSRLYPRFAPPRALLGAASLAAGREFLAAGQKGRARIELERAVASLREALAAEWRGDDVARAAATANRGAAMHALAVLE